MSIRIRSTLKLLGVFVLCLGFALLSSNFGANSNIKKTELGAHKTKSCKWPPESVENILTEAVTFNITLCFSLDTNTTIDTTPAKYPLHSLFHVAATDKKVSFEEIGNISRSLWKLVRYPDVYHTYPQDVPIKYIIKAIKYGRPVRVVPKYNFPIQILRSSRHVCSKATRHDLVIVVKSGVFGWKERERFRAFMQREKDLNPSFSFGVVFSIGLPRKRGGRVFDRQGHKIVLMGPAGDVLEEYTDRETEVMMRIKEEIRKYDDIILADYEDTYYNLTWKTVTNLRWISAFCDKFHGDVFMIIDDDHRVNISVLTQFLDSIPTAKLRKSIFGRVARHDVAYRSPQKKMYLSFQEIPWNKMCDYPRGFSQIIGAGVVDDMAIATAYTRYNYIHEDVYLGLVAFKLGIPLYNVDSMFDHTEFVNKAKADLPFMVAQEKFVQF